MPEVPPKGSGPRLREAMPRPVLIIFVLTCVVAVVGTLVLVLNPGDREDVALYDRRPPPLIDTPFTHDVGGVEQIVPPRTQVPTDAPCVEMDGVVVIGGPAGVARIRAMLVQACRLALGVSEATTSAVRALSGIEIRFAVFDRTGVESTADLQDNVLLLNARFASTKIELVHVVPIILHEAAHASYEGIDPATGADAELNARTVEVEACQRLIPAPDWPRWCEDAREITSMSQAAALTGMQDAGFFRSRRD